MTRFIQSGLSNNKPTKEKKPAAQPAAGKYKVSDLQTKGVKKGLWENHDG